MQTLSLSGNWLDMTSLRDLLDRFPTLEVLDLDHTGIVSVPQDLFYVRAILSINYSQIYNKYQCVFNELRSPTTPSRG